MINLIKAIRLRLVLVIMITFLLPAEGKSQLNYAGKHFFLSLTGEYNSWFDNVRVNLFSKHAAHVQLYFLHTGVTQNYTLVPGEVLSVKYNGITALGTFSSVLYEQVDNRSLEIISDSDITAYAMEYTEYAEDATPILPVDNQKKVTKYFLMGYRDTTTLYWQSPYSIVATCDSTVLQITPKVNSYYHFANVPYTITLNKGETYQLSILSYIRAELTGTKIEVLHSSANMPICIFYGTPTLNISCPFENNITALAADHLFEQLLPADMWDTVVPVIPFENNPMVDLRVIASEDNDSIYFNNTFFTVLNSGDYLDTVIVNPIVVRGSKPIGIAEYMMSLWNYMQPVTYHYGDPDMLWSMPLKCGISDAYFDIIPTMDIPNIFPPLIPSKHFAMVTVISRAQNVNKIRVDNNPVGNLFKPFPFDTTWKYAHIHVDSLDSTFLHHIVSPEKIIAFVCKQYQTGGYTCNLSNWTIDTTKVIPDTVYKCKGVATTLKATIDNLSYRWSTGDINRSVMVTNPGYYSVKYTISGICNSQNITEAFYVVDTQNVSWNDEKIKDSLVKCDNIILHASSALHYEWETGDTTASIIVRDTGVYRVKETISIEPCQILYRLHEFYVRDFAIVFRLGDDTSICKGDSLLLIAPFKETMWSTGATGTTINIQDTGIYIAVYIDSCGREHHDTVEVKRASDCPIHYCRSLEFPTAFSPNGDSKNDVFRAIYSDPVISYHLLIFNRWGQQVYETHLLNDSWNGKYNGEPEDMGTYMFICYIECPTGKRILKGDVTLIR